MIPYESPAIGLEHGQVQSARANQASVLHKSCMQSRHVSEQA